ncbi:MAG TPA: proline iminopeptidase-family hydrolase [Ktedonobacteraceae bacterium]|jgi:proline-specific peptidase
MDHFSVRAEGFLPFQGYRTWYRVIGEHEEPGKFPLLILHGGPGASHDYLEPLEAMAQTGRRVIFYDQLGAGNSDHPHNPALWTVDLFVAELGKVRETLHLDQLHILGQSWGGMLGMQYALTQPDGLVSLTVADSPASMQQWVSEANRLRAQLPPEVQQTLLHHEAQGTTDSQAYQDAVQVFYRRHVCRTDPWPDCVTRAFEKMARYPEVYNTMNGPSEFHVIGTLKTWDITDRLPEINVPTLLLSGRHDEATPLIVETIHQRIAGSRWVIFEESSHMPHVEETQRYLQVLSEFLTRVEQGQARTPD